MQQEKSPINRYWPLFIALIVIIGAAGVIYFKSKTNSHTSNGILDFKYHSKPQPNSLNKSLPTQTDKARKPYTNKKLEALFKQSRTDQAILNYVKWRLGNKEFQDEYDYLLINSVEMVRIISEVYKKTPGTEFAEEHEAMLNLIFEVLQNSTETRESADLARELHAWIIESDADPIDENNPSKSLQLFVFQNYLIYEYDENERKRIANIILHRIRSPQIKAELAEMLHGNHPKKLWIESNIKDQDQ